MCLCFPLLAPDYIRPVHMQLCCTLTIDGTGRRCPSLAAVSGVDDARQLTPAHQTSHRAPSAGILKMTWAESRGSVL